MARKKAAMSTAERLKKKKECEKRRRERLKKDPEKLKALQEKKHKIYLKAKVTGKVKLVADFNERQKRQKRKEWRQATKKYRNKKKEEEEMQAYLQENVQNVCDSERVNQEGNENIPCTSSYSERERVSTQKKKGRKQIRRNKTKSYRQIKKLEAVNSALMKKYHKYKKRYQRLLKGKEKTPTLTPNTKVKKNLRGRKVPDDVRRKLVFAEVITKELESKFDSIKKSEREKQIFTKVISGRILKKYRMLTHTKHFLPLKLHLANKRRSHELIYERQKKASIEFMKRKVSDFLEHEGNSTLCPGKKDVVSRNGKQQQKRYLNNTLKNLHAKFLQAENFRISYSSFCRYKPSWIVPRKVHERDTCLCAKHENMKLLVQKLHFLEIIKERNIDDFLKALTCEKTSEECLARRCPLCTNKHITFTEKEFDFDEQTNVKQWCHKKEKVLSNKTKQMITIQKTTKEEISCTVGELIQMLENRIVPFMEHILNIKHQLEVMRNLKTHLDDSQLVMHVDFSENYACKYASETQSVHFGASKEQITLHTGVMYTAGGIKESFCTLSKSLRHDPYAIAAHLTPILDKYLKQFPTVSRIHFLSDSPSTQYRNKTMYALISYYIPKTFLQIDSITWNYSEAGHGKGAPDGVGAVLKRTADRNVAEGIDISDIDTLVASLGEHISGVHVEVVLEESIKDVELVMEDVEIMSFPGSMKVHQLKWSRNSCKVHFRKLSCFICHTDICSHYHMGVLTTSTMTKDPVHLTDFKIGDWVLVTYDGKQYPGEIIGILQHAIEVTVMYPTIGRKYRWPVHKDQHTYGLSDIVKKIDSPTPSGSRAAFFVFKDL
ncbi:uncharacterized protein LOC134537058 [Bacillus rossius redtenbacheri]|uniref:uncharacterized protein LOC134537058 n=1 Tax=Bacillus rossius redtenbacheri TaxID=93214 RepID=UPI002FDEF0F4